MRRSVTKLAVELGIPRLGIMEDGDEAEKSLTVLMSCFVYVTIIP
jgi:hypothetical protein